mgnify:CR=1 FL=1
MAETGWQVLHKKSAAAQKKCKKVRAEGQKKQFSVALICTCWIHRGDPMYLKNSSWQSANALVQYIGGPYEFSEFGTSPGRENTKFGLQMDKICQIFIIIWPNFIKNP